MTAPGSRPAIFLDRDGTLIEDSGYLADPASVRLLPGVAEALIVLERAGYLRIVITNQSGIARGFFSEAVVEEVHRHIASMLEAGAARIDAYYYCPHHPDGAIAELSGEREGIQRELDTLRATHAKLPRPAEAGRHIGHA